LLTRLTRSIISINQREAVKIAFLYSILFGIMPAIPWFLIGIIRYPKSKGKKDPSVSFLVNK